MSGLGFLGDWDEATVGRSVAHHSVAHHSVARRPAGGAVDLVPSISPAAWLGSRTILNKGSHRTKNNATWQHDEIQKERNQNEKTARQVIHLPGRF